MTTTKNAPARTKKGATARTKKPAGKARAAAVKLKKAAAIAKPNTAGRTKPATAASDGREVRAAAGKSMRRQVPLEAHAQLDGRGSNSDPVKLLEQQSADRVPELIPIRYGRMLVSPFTFYRGAALLMATDLTQGPRTDLTTQICGDAHLSNFGVFASPERQLVFDLNDFDETWPGPFEWDVKRLAASLEIAGRGNGLRRKRRRAITLAAVKAYRLSMAEFAAQPALQVWYARAELQPGLPRLMKALPKSSRLASQRAIDKSRRRDAHHALGKLTTVEDGQRRFVS